jgi:hypothetical protein
LGGCPGGGYLLFDNESIMVVEDLKVKIKKRVSDFITTILPSKDGWRTVKVQGLAQPKKGKDGYIIIDPENDFLPDEPMYWSEEEGGRFSGGALYEKTFRTHKDAEDYINLKNIKGVVIPHSQHWTGGTAIMYDSNKPGGNHVCKN